MSIQPLHFFYFTFVIFFQLNTRPGRVRRVLDFNLTLNSLSTAPVIGPCPDYGQKMYNDPPCFEYFSATYTTPINSWTFTI